MVSLKGWVIAGLSLTLPSVQVWAQQDNVKTLEASRDRKLASPFLAKGDWTTDYDLARHLAGTSGKLILGYFTRSYAPCGPCRDLEELFFSKDPFIEYSRSVVRFCHISTRLPDDPQRFLFAEKGGTAFPTLMILDREGNVLARGSVTGAWPERSLAMVKELVDEGWAFAGLIRAAEEMMVLKSGETVPVASLETRSRSLARRIEYGHFTPDVARARVKALGALPPDLESWLKAVITSQECSLALLDIRKAGDDVEGQIHAARKFVEMKEAGSIPSDRNVVPFWEWIMAYASHHRRAGLYEDALNALRNLLPDDEDRRERLRDFERTLEKLKRETPAAQQDSPAGPGSAGLGVLDIVEDIPKNR